MSKVSKPQKYNAATSGFPNLAKHGVELQNRMRGGLRRGPTFSSMKLNALFRSEVASAKVAGLLILG